MKNVSFKLQIYHMPCILIKTTTQYLKTYLNCPHAINFCTENYVSSNLTYFKSTVPLTYPLKTRDVFRRYRGGALAFIF